MRSIPLYTLALFALGGVAATGATANASEDRRHLDSTIVDIDRATGQAWFDNVISLDPSITPSSYATARSLVIVSACNSAALGSCGALALSTDTH